MNELNPDVAAALRHYSCVDVPRDWDDVLHRAGTRRRVRPQLAAAAIAIGLVLAAAPAFGVADGLRGLLDRDRPVVRVTAALHGPGGLSGRVELEAPGAVLVQPGRRRVIPLIPRGRDPGPRRLRRQAFRWELALHGADEAMRAVIVRRGRVLATLCAPCEARASGTVGLTVVQAVTVITGATAVRVDTEAGTLRGAIRFPPRR